MGRITVFGSERHYGEAITSSNCPNILIESHIMRINDQTIDQAFADHKKTYGGVRNDYFAPVYLATEHQIDIDQALLQTTFGGGDYGFDAFHFDPATGNLYLYQFKW